MDKSVKISIKCGDSHEDGRLFFVLISLDADTNKFLYNRLTNKLENPYDIYGNDNLSCVSVRGIPVMLSKPSYEDLLSFPHFLQNTILIEQHYNLREFLVMLSEDKEKFNIEELLTFFKPSDFACSIFDVDFLYSILESISFEDYYAYTSFLSSLVLKEYYKLISKATLVKFFTGTSNVNTEIMSSLLTYHTKLEKLDNLITTLVSQEKYDYIKIIFESKHKPIIVRISNLTSKLLLLSKEYNICLVYDEIDENSVSNIELLASIDDNSYTRIITREILNDINFLKETMKSGIFDPKRVVGDEFLSLIIRQRETFEELMSNIDIESYFLKNESQIKCVFDSIRKEECTSYIVDLCAKYFTNYMGLLVKYISNIKDENILKLILSNLSIDELNNCIYDIILFNDKNILSYAMLLGANISERIITYISSITNKNERESILQKIIEYNVESISPLIKSHKNTEYIILYLKKHHKHHKNSLFNYLCDATEYCNPIIFLTLTKIIEEHYKNEISTIPEMPYVRGAFRNGEYKLIPHKQRCEFLKILSEKKIYPDHRTILDMIEHGRYSDFVIILLASGYKLQIEHMKALEERKGNLVERIQTKEEEKAINHKPETPNQFRTNIMNFLASCVYE